MINVSSAGIEEEGGDSYIPASQRPDGTWRKARRVKEGYVPQEEVPLYESKGKKFLNRQLTPTEPIKVDGMTGHKTIPGLFIENKEKATKSKKKTKKIDDVTASVEKLKVNETTKPKVPVEAVDPAKKLKNLKKRLREVEALELKLKNGEIKKPEPEQLTKIQRKNDLIMQIRNLEKQMA